MQSEKKVTALGALIRTGTDRFASARRLRRLWFCSPRLIRFDPLKTCSSEFLPLPFAPSPRGREKRVSRVAGSEAPLRAAEPPADRRSWIPQPLRRARDGWGGAAEKGGMIGY